MNSIKIIALIFGNILLYPLVILVVTVFWMIGKINFNDLLGKLGYVSLSSVKGSVEKDYIWLHLSSVGEWNTGKIFAKHLLQKSGCQLLITYFNGDVKNIIDGEIKEGNFLNQECKAMFLPIENTLIYLAIHRFYRIKSMVILETETWPSMILTTHWLQKPVFLVNATLFDQETKRLSYFKFFFKIVFNAFDKVYVISENSLKNFIQIGVNPERIIIKPNLKYDLLERMPNFSQMNLKFSHFETLSIYLDEQIRLKRKIIVLASVHYQEMKKIIPSLKSYFEDQNFCLIIVPRNLDNIAKWKKLLVKHQISCIFRDKLDKNVKINEQYSIKNFLLNSFGELLFTYYKADLIIMGGTFVPIGGHNFLEALYYGKKVILGPFYYHFEDFVHDFKEEIEIVDIKRLSQSIKKVFNNVQFTVLKKFLDKLKNFSGSSVKIAEDICKNI